MVYYSESAGRVCCTWPVLYRVLLLVVTRVVFGNRGPKLRHVQDSSGFQRPYHEGSINDIYQSGAGLVLITSLWGQPAAAAA